MLRLTLMLAILSVLKTANSLNKGVTIYGQNCNVKKR